MQKTEQEPTKQLKSERRLTNFFATAFSTIVSTIGSFFLISREANAGERKINQIYDRATHASGIPESISERIAEYSKVILKSIPTKLQTDTFKDALRTQAEAYGTGPVYVHDVSAELRKANGIVSNALDQANIPWFAQNQRNALISAGTVVFAAAAVTLGAIHLYRKHQEKKQPASHTEKLVKERVQTAAMGAPANQR